jgi:hypothetical protein
VIEVKEKRRYCNYADIEWVPQIWEAQGQRHPRKEGKMLWQFLGLCQDGKVMYLRYQDVQRKRREKN